MQHKEYEFEKRCRAMARQAGWVAVKMEKCGHKGIPDDLFISPEGLCIMIEFKKDERQRPRPEQVAWLSRYPSLCYVVGSEAQFEQVTGLSQG